MIPEVSSSIPNYKLLGVFDALYANNPHIKILQDEGISYIIGVKNSHVYELAKEYKSQALLHKTEWEKDGKRCEVHYYNGFTLNMTHLDTIVNYFDFTEINIEIGATIYYSSWITNLKVRKEIIQEIVAVARSR